MSTENIVKFLQTAYSDERLAALLAHTESGQLHYYSCCCLIGIPTAQHALQGYADFNIGEELENHVHQARLLPFAREAEDEFANFCLADSERRKKLLPLIYAEIARRDKEREEFIRPDTSGKSDESEEVQVTSQKG